MNKAIVRILLLLVLAAAIAVGLAYREHLDVTALEAWVAGTGAAAPLLFIGLYALATVLFLPGSVLTLAGGAVFGPVWGTLYNLTGATLGAVLAFVIARYLASNWVQTRVEASAGGRVERLVKGVEAEGWRFVAFTRLVPLFPFNLLNYALGLTRIPLLHYTVATYVFMLPGALAYTYLGFAGREAVAGGEGHAIGCGHFVGVARSCNDQTGNRATRCQLLNRLMRWTIFTQTDRIVSEHVQHRQTH